MGSSHLKAIHHGDTVLVVGLGKSVLSAVRFFLQQGANVKLSDSSFNHSQESIDWLASQNVETEFGLHSEEFFSNVDLVLISPGVPHHLPILELVRAKGIPVCGELALAPVYLKTPVIAITGTNGKTTTTTLVGEIVRASGKEVFVGGNIGTPLTDYLVGDQNADWLVLEISSFQLDAAGTFRPDIGILLNITPDHLDRYDTFNEYSISKMNLFEHQKSADFVIYNSDDYGLTKLMLALKRLRVGALRKTSLSFGHDGSGTGQARYCDDGVNCNFNGQEHHFDLTKTPFLDFPNRENGAAAILGCLAAGCSHASIIDGIGSFVPLAHRMAFVGEFNGVQYINDSKATNTGAVKAALKASAKPVILIAGGRDKGGKFSDLQNIVAEKVKHMLLIGEARELMAKQFDELTNIEFCASLSGAVKRAGELSIPGDIVLFSPACASFDMFKSYVHRGEVFEKIVYDL